MYLVPFDPADQFATSLLVLIPFVALFTEPARTAKRALDGAATQIKAKLLPHFSGGTGSLVMSYLGLRRCIGGLGIGLPLALMFGWMLLNGKWGIQRSISDYYYTSMRNVLVGGLCSIGIFLLSEPSFAVPSLHAPGMRLPEIDRICGKDRAIDLAPPTDRTDWRVIATRRGRHHVKSPKTPLPASVHE